MIIIPDKLFLWNYFWYKTQDPGTSIACYSWHRSQLHSGLGLGLGVLENPGTYYCSRRWRPGGHSIACSVALLCSKAVDSWTLQRNTTALPWRVRRPPNLDKSWQAALFCPQWPPATAFNIRFPRIFSPNQIPWKLMTTWPLTSTHFCLVVHNQILEFRRYLMKGLCFSLITGFPNVLPQNWPFCCKVYSGTHLSHKIEAPVKKSESVCYFATTSHRWRRCGRKKTLWYSMILNSDPM